MIMIIFSQIIVKRNSSPSGAMRTRKRRGASHEPALALRSRAFPTGPKRRQARRTRIPGAPHYEPVSIAELSRCNSCCKWAGIMQKWQPCN
jgi:hypothetical protein